MVERADGDNVRSEASLMDLGLSALGQKNATILSPWAALGRWPPVQLPSRERSRLMAFPPARVQGSVIGGISGCEAKEGRLKSAAVIRTGR